MEAKGAVKNPWVAGILSGVLPGLGQFWFGSLIVLALVIWSITDAARTAKRAQM